MSEEREIQRAYDMGFISREQRDSILQDLEPARFEELYNIIMGAVDASAPLHPEIS